MMKTIRSFANSKLLRNAFLISFIAFGIVYLISFQEGHYWIHARYALDGTNKPNDFFPSMHCNQKETCANGDPYWLYFYSTNGRGHPVFDYMITIITFPNGEQYYNTERFDYQRSRVIADPADEFSRKLAWISDQGPVDEYDIWRIRNASDHHSLKKVLADVNFKQVNK